MDPGKWALNRFSVGREITAEELATLKRPITDPRVQHAIELFQHNHAVPLSELSKSVDLSPSRFRHLFRQAVGISPAHYFQLARLQLARTLLENSFMSVKEISVLVGINDESHFVRHYKRFYGERPSQTRLRSAASSRPLGTAASANK